MGWMAPLRHLGAKVLVGENQSADKEPSMNEITTVGLFAGQAAPGGSGHTKTQSASVPTATLARLICQ